MTLKEFTDSISQGNITACIWKSKHTDNELDHYKYVAFSNMVYSKWNFSNKVLRNLRYYN